MSSSTRFPACRAASFSAFRWAGISAVAGIASPERFVGSLRNDGWNVVDSMTFKDHHRYSAGDLAAIAAKMQSAGAEAVFTTDKDAVRFESLDTGSLPLYRVPLHVEFEPADALFGSVKAVLETARARSIELRRAT